MGGAVANFSTNAGRCPPMAWSDLEVRVVAWCGGRGVWSPHRSVRKRGACSCAREGLFCKPQSRSLDGLGLIS